MCHSFFFKIDASTNPRWKQVAEPFDVIGHQRLWDGRERATGGCKAPQPWSIVSVSSLQGTIKVKRNRMSLKDAWCFTGAQKKKIQIDWKLREKLDSTQIHCTRLHLCATQRTWRQAQSFLHAAERVAQMTSKALQLALNVSDEETSDGMSIVWVSSCE